MQAATGPDPALAGDLAAFAAREARAGEWPLAATHLLQAAGLCDGGGRDRIVADAVDALARCGRLDEAARLIHMLPPDCPAEAVPEPAADPPEAEAGCPGRDPQIGRGLVRSWVGDPADAVADLERLLRRSDGPPVFQRVLAHARLGYTLDLLGRWDDATVHAETSVALAGEAEQPWMTGYSCGLAAMVPAKRGDWAAAERHLEQGRLVSGGLVGSRVHLAVGEAWLAVSRGDAERVVRALEPLLPAEWGMPDEPGVLDWRDLLSDAYVALGSPGRAREALAPFEREALARGRKGPLARVHRARGVLLAATGEPSAAARSFELGLACAAGAGTPFEQARLDLDYGRFLRRRGSRRLAAERLEAAHRVFAGLRAAPFLECCTEELEACGRTVADTGRPWNLTARELAVARLVAAGESNRQVGRRLMLSVKTVEYHLGHVFAKLGVRNRTELACRFVGAGPAAG